MSFGSRGTGTRQMIWRKTFKLRYLIENGNGAVLFDCIEFKSGFFPQLLVESTSSVKWQIVSKSGENLKAKGKKNAFNR